MATVGPHKRSHYKGGYHLGGSWPTMNEPDSRYYRRHGKYSELRFRTEARKVAIKRKRENNPRLVRFNFLHHNI